MTRGRGGPELDRELARAIGRLAPICASLPEVVEEDAWIGVRWRIRGRTFAHVLPIVDGAPAAYAQALGHDGPAVVVTFRSDGPELDALAALGPPWFTARWGRPIAGVQLAPPVPPAVAGLIPDDDELRELLTESYCLLAPKKLVAQVDRPTP